MTYSPWMPCVSSVSVSIQAMHSCYLFRLFIHAIYSGKSFMLSIQAIHLCYLFRLFIHAIYSGNSVMLSIQAIHSCYLFRLFIQAIYSGHISFGSKRNFEFFQVLGHTSFGSKRFFFYENHLFFEDRLKRCFDNGFVIYAKFRVDLYLGFIQRCFLRRVMAEQRSN